MIYFKKKYFNTERKKEQAEIAVRKVSSKRKISLDFLSSSTMMGTENLFLGVEDQTDVKFTRIRSTFERILPKLIVSFPKSPQNLFYKIKFSLLTSFVFVFLLATSVLRLFQLLAGKAGLDDLLQQAILFSLFIFLTVVEVKLTERAIEKAILKGGL